MTFRLVFDVSQRIPEIAIGIAAVILLIGVIAAGLWAFEDLVKAWRLIAVASLALALVEILLEQSRSALFPLAFGVIGVGAEVARTRVDGLDQVRTPRGAIATLTCTFLLVWTAGSGVGRFGAIDLTNRLNAGQAQVLEGPVTQFSEVPLKNECFSVADRRFCYSDSGATPGFSRTNAYGGPILPGLPVRVWAIGDTIVRLEIATPAATPAATP
jgi:hypothetical protein